MANGALITVQEKLIDEFLRVSDQDLPKTVVLPDLGECRVALVKCYGPDGAHYVGRVRQSNGQHVCRYPFTLERGDRRGPYVVGGGALSFIAGNGEACHDRHKRADAHLALIVAFLIKVLGKHQQEDHDAVIAEYLDEVIPSGCHPEKGEMTKKERNRLGLLGFDYSVVGIAEQHGFHFEVDYLGLGEAVLNPTFAGITTGDWDVLAEQLAITSNLPSGLVGLLQENGYKLERRYGQPPAQKPQPEAAQPEVKKEGAEAESTSAAASQIE